MKSLAALLCLLLASRPAAPPAASEDESVLVPVKILGVAATQPVVTVDAGRNEGIAPHDLLYVLDSKRKVVRGAVILTSGRQAAAHLDAADPPELPASSIVLRVGVLGSLCRYMPPSASVCGHVTRIPPGQTTAWINMGKRAGLQLGDRLLVRRESLVNGDKLQIPIARGEVVVLDDAVSLVSLRPVVSNAVTQMGDPVELWPAPGLARFGRINTGVLTVTPHREGNVLIVAGSAADGFVEGHLLDITRGARFIGTASIIETSPKGVTRAQMINSASVDTAREADTAILRAPPGPPAQPLLAPIFRIQGNYCLVAAGEVDGVEQGEKLIVSRADPQTAEVFAVAEITIENVKIDYAGGKLVQLDPNVNPVNVWEFAERRRPPWPRWRPVGIVTSVDPGTRTVQADIELNSNVQPGDLIELSPGGELRPATALVLWRFTDHCVAAVPDGWGDLQPLVNAQVLIPELVTPGTTKSSDEK